MNKKLAIILAAAPLVLAIALLPGTGSADDEGDSAAAEPADAPITASGEELYRGLDCFSCHGDDGKNPPFSHYPKIAGQNPKYVLQQLKDIKSGKRTNGQTAVMKAVLHLVNEDEMEVLAEYISTLDP